MNFMLSVKHILFERLLFFFILRACGIGCSTMNRSKKIIRNTRLRWGDEVAKIFTEGSCAGAGGDRPTGQPNSGSDLPAAASARPNSEWGGRAKKGDKGYRFWVSEDFPDLRPVAITTPSRPVARSAARHTLRSIL